MCVYAHALMFAMLYICRNQFCLLCGFQGLNSCCQAWYPYQLNHLAG